MINALTVYNGELIAGGSFSTAGGVPANGLARWDGSAWYALGILSPLAVRDLTVAGADLIVLTGDSILRWNGTTAEVFCGGGGNIPGCGSSFTALVVYQGQVLVGLSGYCCYTNHSCEYYGLVMQMGTCGDYLTETGPVYALAVYDGQLVAAGTSIARWDGSNWTVLSSPGVTDGQVEALTTYDNGLVAAGFFSTIDGAAANKIARWDGITWEALGSGMEGTDAVLELAVYAGDLIAAGYFASAGGAPASNIARWDSTNWHPLGMGTNY